MRIRAKVVLSFFCITLLIGVVSFFVISVSQSALTSSVGGQAQVLAVKISDQLDRSIDGKIEDLELYSSDLLLRELLLRSNDEFGKLASVEGYLSAVDAQWRSVDPEVITPFMGQLINNSAAEELREQLEHYEWEHGYPVFGEIFVTNRFGANVAQTGKTTDYRQDDEGWWQVARDQGVYVSDVAYDSSAGIHSIDIAVRIGDEREFLGVIKGVLNIDYVMELVGEAQTEFEVLLFTRDGKILYNDGNEFQFLEDFSHRDFFGKLAADSGFFSAPGEAEGEPDELYAYARSSGYKHFPGLGWITLVQHDKAVVLRPVLALRNRLIVFSLAVLVFALGLGTALSYRIIGPLEALSVAARRVKRGNLAWELTFSSRDEVGVLARAFEEMRLGLRDRNELLNSLLSVFGEKGVGEVASILARRNVQGVVDRNPRVYRLLPKSLRRSIRLNKK